MAYDNKKLEAAVGKWLTKHCDVGYGEVYSGALQRSFEGFLHVTGALQSSPGDVAFGREMTRRGFGRKRKNGLQYMTGLVLKDPVGDVFVRRYQKQGDPEAKAAQSRDDRRKKARKNISARIRRIKNTDAVEKRVKLETKKRNMDAGEVD